MTDILLMVIVVQLVAIFWGLVEIHQAIQPTLPKASDSSKECAQAERGE